MTYKEHLRNNLIISVAIYLIACVAQRTFIISDFSEVGASCTAAALACCNGFYYVLRYLEGDFSYEK